MITKQNLNETILDDALISLIRKKRKEKGFTQVEMASMLNISSKKYSRIETSNITKINNTMLKQICSILDIDFTQYEKQHVVRCSFSLTQDVRANLEILKTAKGFSSLSETINYCIEEVMNDFFLRKASHQLLDELREMMVNTYHQELEKISRENEINKHMLEKFGESFHLDVDRERKNLNDEFNKIHHAKKY